MTALVSDGLDASACRDPPLQHHRCLTSTCSILPHFCVFVSYRDHTEGAPSSNSESMLETDGSPDAQRGLSAAPPASLPCTADGNNIRLTKNLSTVNLKLTDSRSGLCAPPVSEVKNDRYSTEPKHQHFQLDAVMDGYRSDSTEWESAHCGLWEHLSNNLNYNHSHSLCFSPSALPSVYLHGNETKQKSACSYALMLMEVSSATAA